METGQSQNRPDGEEADDHFDDTSPRVFQRSQQTKLPPVLTNPLRVEHNVADRRAKQKQTEKGEEEEKEVKVAIVTSAHAVTHPRTVMVKPGDTIVTQ